MLNLSYKLLPALGRLYFAKQVEMNLLDLVEVVSELMMDEYEDFVNFATFGGGEVLSF